MLSVIALCITLPWMVCYEGLGLMHYCTKTQRIISFADLGKTVSCFTEKIFLCFPSAVLGPIPAA